MAEIRLEKLRKEYGKLVAVRDVTIQFPEANVTCLLGPSGCGKTTLMRMIAGLEEPTSGDVYFDNDRVTDLSTRERNIGMVFQYPVVYRGMDVYRNIELPLIEDRSLSRADRRARVENVLETLELTDAAGLDVSQLDNGTRQKVAVAREVARQPRILLFDEPVTNVDVNSRLQLKRALKRLVKQHGQTIVYVTHDQTEAMTLADDIALMRDGKIVQRGTPREIYNAPADRFGGWFLGNPGMNFVEHQVARNGDGALLKAPLFARALRVSLADNVDQVVVGIRPERILVDEIPGPEAVEGHLRKQTIVVGGLHLLTIDVGDAIIKAKVSGDSRRFREGSPVFVRCPLEHVVLFGLDGGRLDADSSYALSTN